MARFRGTVQGTRGSASRLGHKALHVEANGPMTAPREGHTPVPWRAGTEFTFVIAGRDDDPIPIADTDYDIASPDYETAKANAAFIVRAVNSHAALVSALRDAEFLLRKVSINWKEAGSMVDSFKRSAEDARAALSAATEGEGR